MRFSKHSAILIVLLSAAQLFAWQGPVSPGKKAPAATTSSNAIPDWRENLTKNADAPVKIVEFFDYQCPYCASTIPALQQFLKDHPGDVQLIVKHNPLSIHPDSMLAHQAALAAAEQGKFWEMNDILFAHQRQVKLPDLLDYARRLDLNLASFQKALESGKYKAAVEQDMALAQAVGADATPTFFVNGQKLIGTQTVERLQSAIKGDAGPEAQTADSPAISLDRLDFSHSPVRGTPGAPITIVEFSDLQCPFCARVVPTLAELLKENPGKIKLVFKNFPLSFHADSSLAHRAALAAGEQGKFWEMHDLIFAGQSAIKKDDLLAKARRLNLDMAKFTADLESDKLREQVEHDKSEGDQLGISGTPTFFINGVKYTGAMPIGQFTAALKQAVPRAELANAAAPPSHQETPPAVSLGPADAPIKLVWFSDLQSNLTLKAALLVRQLNQAHSGKIQIVFKNRPLEIHDAAMLLHQAALAANAQGKFWQMHDLIIANPQKTALSDLTDYAQRLGLDVKQFEADLNSHKFVPAIQTDLQEAQRRAVLGTPVFFVNSVRVDGLQPMAMFEKIISDELSKTAQPQRASATGN